MKYSILTLVLSISIGAFAQDQNSPCPCCTEQHRQFDFWLGDWETTANDKLAGTNKIVLMQDSCVIQENWVSANGNFTGTSYNFYNANIKKWQQVWVDNQGGNLVLTGKRKGNQMIMVSKGVNGFGRKKILQSDYLDP